MIVKSLQGQGGGKKKMKGFRVFGVKEKISTRFSDVAGNFSIKFYQLFIYIYQLFIYIYQFLFIFINF